MNRYNQQLLASVVLAMVFLVGLALPAAAQVKEPPWVWNPADPNFGPQAWGDILGPDGKKLYPECSGGPDQQGNEQTPIDITNPELKRLPTLEIKYGDTPLNVLNDFRQIQVRNGNYNSRLVFDGESYQLVQFHFHTPSEHAVDGERAAMEAHFVHMNSYGQIAVLAVFYKLGERNPALEAILANAPRKNRTYIAGEKEVRGISLNPLELLPRGQEYFHYIPGAFTNPPCSEQLFWFILKNPATVSQEQVDTYMQILHDVQDFSTNARPLQNPQDRTVFENQGGRVDFKHIRGVDPAGTFEKSIGIGGIQKKSEIGQ